MRIQFNGPIAAALAAALALTSLNLSPAQAAPRNSGQPEAAQGTATTTTDFSAHRRHHRRGNAAALGAAIGVFGAIAALAARDRYRDNYYYRDPYYGPYYGAPYGYGPSYRYRYWRHRHHY